MSAPQCSNCFFGQTTQTFGGSTLRVCRNRAPLVDNEPNVSSTTYLWPPVADTDWCGDGADSLTGASYSGIVYGLPFSIPQTPTIGSFAPTAGSTFVVDNSNVTAASRINIWGTNALAQQEIAAGEISITTLTPGTSFTVTCSSFGGFAGTETFGYQIIG